MRVQTETFLALGQDGVGGVTQQITLLGQPWSVGVAYFFLYIIENIGWVWIPRQIQLYASCRFSSIPPACAAPDQAHRTPGEGFSLLPRPFSQSQPHAPCNTKGLPQTGRKEAKNKVSFLELLHKLPWKWNPWEEGPITAKTIMGLHTDLTSAVYRTPESNIQGGGSPCLSHSNPWCYMITIALAAGTGIPGNKKTWLCLLAHCSSSCSDCFIALPAHFSFKKLAKCSKFIDTVGLALQPNCIK